MKPITKTLLMGVLAAVLCGVAFAFYPRISPEAVTGETGQKLFEEFENQVWTIQIAEFDRDNENLKTLSLRRKAQKWVMGKSNMVLTGPLIAVAVGSLNEKTILQEESDNEQDHANFGVVDPLEFQTVKNRDSLGAKITLEDVNRNTLGSLIVGHRVKDTQDQYYVRRPGQPKVYTINFERAVLTTAMGDWMDTNIMNLQSPRNPDGLTLNSITIRNYRLETVKPYSSTFFYNTTIQVTPEGLLLKELRVDGKKLTNYKPNQEQAAQLSRVSSMLQFVQLVDIEAKPTELSEMLAGDFTKLTYDQFKPAAGKGFLRSPTKGGYYFQGANGSVTAFSNEGVETTLLFGNIAKTLEAPSDSLNYYMIVVAEVSSEFQQEPPAPKPAEPGGELTDDEKKRHARKMKEWKSKLESATQRVNEINRQHADWYYVVSDDLVGQLRPDLKIELPPTENPENPEAPQKPTEESEELEEPEEEK